MSHHPSGDCPPIFPQITRAPLESHRYHARSIALIACCRCCRATSPAHGASGHLVPLARSNCHLRCQCARCRTAEPPQCPGMSRSMTSYTQHVVTGLSCHLSCVRRLAPEPSARVCLSMNLAVKTFPGSGHRRLAARPCHGDHRARAGGAPTA
jgi:hypothetical protein